MASKPALTLERSFRSGSEELVAAQLDNAGVDYEYESTWVHYDVPARRAKYLPDFPVKDTNIILEVKGRFGGRYRGSKGAEERQKLILLKEQHPELDIRIIFDRASMPIYKGSKTTYAKWADDHGFKWADKRTVPAAWLAEIKKAQRK